MSFMYPSPDWRFCDASYGGVPVGTFFMPFPTFPMAFTLTPDHGTLWVQPGYYAAADTYSRPMTIRAPLGGVTIGS
jgi:hypothetical protein